MVIEINVLKILISAAVENSNKVILTTEKLVLFLSNSLA